MKLKRKIIIIGAAIIVLLAGASLFCFFYLGSPSRQVLAMVNDEKISVEQFDRELSKMKDPLREMFKEEPLQFLEGIIVKRLLLQEAKKEGLSTPVKTYKDTAKDSPPPEETLISEFINKKFPSPPEVTKEEIKAFYSIFKSQMAGKSLNQVAPLIEQYIREEKRKEELQQLLVDLRKNAKVEIDQDRLKKITIKPPESNTKEDFENALRSGKPVLVDFGANSCVPCRQIRPILKEVGNEYAEKTRVLVIDVYKYQDLAREYKILLIPTLVFFDSKGKEAFRHVGILEKEQIVSKLKEIGMAS